MEKYAKTIEVYPVLVARQAKNNNGIQLRIKCYNFLSENDFGKKKELLC